MMSRSLERVKMCETHYLRLKIVCDIKAYLLELLFDSMSVLYSAGCRNTDCPLNQVCQDGKCRCADGFAFDDCYVCRPSGKCKPYARRLFCNQFGSIYFCIACTLFSIVLLRFFNCVHHLNVEKLSCNLSD